MITADTAIVHIARAFDKPMVVVYNKRKLKDTGLPGYTIWAPGYIARQIVCEETNVADMTIDAVWVYDQIAGGCPDRRSPAGTKKGPLRALQRFAFRLPLSAMPSGSQTAASFSRGLLMINMPCEAIKSAHIDKNRQPVAAILLLAPCSRHNPPAITPASSSARPDYAVFQQCAKIDAAGGNMSPL